MDARTMEVFEDGSMDQAAHARAQAEAAGALVELTQLQAALIKVKEENARRERELREAKRKVSRAARKKNR